MKKIKHLICILFALCLGFTARAALSANQPVWWADAESLAVRDGYRLISSRALRALYQHSADFLVVDVRPDYEYKAGHLPGAVQIEFDPGDKYRLEDRKKARFEKVLGPEKNRLIIIYCRNYN